MKIRAIGKYLAFLVHNVVAHPLLVVPCRFTTWLHDFTARGM